MFWLNRERLPKILFLFSIIIFVLNQQPLQAQTMPIPANIQAALMTKVLKFNSKLADKPSIKMLVVYDASSRLGKDELVNELVKSMEVKAVVSSELGSFIHDYDVVYFMPGAQENWSLCKENKVLTIAGVSKYAEDGTVSIAFGLQNDKPKIFVNISSLKSEEQNLSSELLRIAKVYK